MKQFWSYVMGAVLLAGCASPAPIRFHTLDAGMAAGVAGAVAGAGQPPLRFEVVVTVPERLNRDNIVLARRVVPVADTSLQVLEDQRWESVFGDALRDALAARLAHEVVTRQQAAAVAGERDEVVERVGERAEVSDGHGAGAPEAGVGVPVAGLRRPLLAGPEQRPRADEGAVRQSQDAGALASRRPDARPVPMRLDVQVYRFDGSVNGALDVLLDWRLRRLDSGRDEADTDSRRARLECRHAFARPDAGGGVDGVVAAMQQQVVRLAADVVASSQAWLDTGRPACLRASPIAAGGDGDGQG